MSNPIETKQGGAARRITGPAIQLAALSAAGLVLAVGFQLSVAALFGTSSELDAFWIALALPKAIIDSIHLGLPTILFILIFNMPEDEASADTRSELASSVLNYVLLGTFVVVPLLIVAAPALTRWMGRGLDEAHLADAARMLQILALLLVPSAVAGALAGILHAHRRFLPFAIGRVLSFLVQIVVLLVLVNRLDLGHDALVWATFAGTAAMLACSVPGFLQTGFRYRFVLRWQGPRERTVVKVTMTMVAFSLLDRLNQGVDRFVASYLEPGSISALEFAWRFEIPIVHVLSMSVALPTLAIMAGHAGEKQWSEVRATLSESLRLMTLLVIPVIGFIVVLREPLTTVWFERGAFSSDSARLVASLLPFMGWMFLMRAFGTITVYAVLSLGKLGPLLTVLAIESLINIGLNALFFQRFGLRGVVLATAISMTVGNFWIGRLLLRSLHLSWRSLAADLKKPLVSSVCSVLALAVFYRVFGIGWIGSTHLTQAIELCALGLLFLFGQFLLVNRFRLVDLSSSPVRP